MQNGKQGYPVGQVFETQYYEKCGICAQEMVPGDRVVYMDQDTLVHGKHLINGSLSR